MERTPRLGVGLLTWSCYLAVQLQSGTSLSCIALEWPLDSKYPICVMAVIYRD